MKLSPRKKGWLLLPRNAGVMPPSGGRSGSGVRLGMGKGKEIVPEDGFLEPKEAALLHGREERSEAEVWRQFREAGLLDESVLQRSEKEALVERISELEKELHDYQYHMGLLLIEKEDWSSKYEMLSQELAEAVHNQKRLQAKHMVAISEFDKQEKSMGNIMQMQKRSIVNLQKALNEMHAEHAEVKLKSDNKLAQAHDLETNIEEKYLEIKLKVHSLNASVAEASRKSSEIDRRLEDVEAREHKLQKEHSSFITKKRIFKEDLDRQREHLLAWEQELQQHQKKLSKGQYCLDERETEANERERIFKKKEKELAEAWKNLQMFDDSLKLKEQDICMRCGTLDSKEKEIAIKQENLVMKEKNLLAREEELSIRERVEMPKLMDDQNSLLESQKKEFELDVDKKCKTLDERLKMKLDSLANKEVTLENKEEIFGKEHVLVREMEKLKDKEKENKMILNAMKESLVNQMEDLRRDRDKFEKEWELLDERQMSMEVALEQFNHDKESFAKWKRLEEEKLQNEKLEMTDRVNEVLELRQNKRTYKDVIACMKLDNFELHKGENFGIACQFDANDTPRNKEQLELTNDGISTNPNASKALKLNVLLSAENNDASPPCTCPQSVSLERRMSWLQRCSRLLSFSSEKTVGQPTGTQSEKPIPSDVCLTAEALQHKASVEPGQFLGVVNMPSDTQRIQTVSDDQIILEAKRSYRVDDTAEPSCGIAHSSTNVLKSQAAYCPRGSNDKEGSSMHPEIDSEHQPFKQKRRRRSGSVFVKKARSVNALMEDDKASIQQNSLEKHSGSSTSAAKVHPQKCIEGRCILNVGQKVTNTGPVMHCCHRSRTRNSELDAEDPEDHYESLSSQGCEKDEYSSPEIEVPGLKHYNFRHSTIVRAVAVADRAKRRKKERHQQSHENDMLKVIGDDELETRHNMQSFEVERSQTS